MDHARHYTLRLSCPDAVGIVARVAAFFAESGGWILRSSQHADLETNRYFMRMDVCADSLALGLDELRRRFEPVARAFEMDWQINDSEIRKRVVILVSRELHCLYDLLERRQSGELDIDIAAVISNHDDARGLVEWHGITFHHVAMRDDDKSAAHAEIERLFMASASDTMVLARFMQILPTGLCTRLHGRILNIHHSFLPSFVGAQPYLQAYRRGVKQVGATCHYVTPELDQGPIIDQDVIRVDHADTVQDLIRHGKDVEKAVLARGLRDHLEDRVLINGNRTVVLR